MQKTEQHLFENHSQDSRYRGPMDVCPMLSAQMGTGGNNQPFVVEATVYESHPMDSRIKELEGVSPTVSAKWHKGAADTPLVVECAGFKELNSAKARSDGYGYEKAPTLSANKHDASVVYCLQGNGIDRADTAGCNGKGWKEDTGYTLNTVDRPAVVYALDRAFFNQGQNALYDPQYYDDGSCPTLVARGPSAVAFQTYQKVSGPLMANSHPGSYTGQDAFSDMLVAGCDEDIRYIVRRLTPTECARLQGFPDDWGRPDYKDSFTDDEYEFWLNVRNTHAEINGKTVKQYTKEQMLSWYNKLHTDSAEYKMWGNGIALPNALFVMGNIAEALGGVEQWTH